LLDALNNVCRMIQACTGVEFDLDRNAQTGQRSIDSGKTVHKFTLYFKDFYGKTSKMTIALRMDVTEFGRLYLPIQQRKLIHPYSDQADCAVTLEVVSLEEASLEHAGGLPARITPSRPFLPERQPWPRSPSPLSSLLATVRLPVRAARQTRSGGCRWRLHRRPRACRMRLSTNSAGSTCRAGSATRPSSASSAGSRETG
jgi:hypothetical protein